MADKSTIEWTDATWNPLTGCTLASRGCKHCYAAHLAATRLKNHPSREGLAVMNKQGIAKFTGEVRFNEEWLDQPLRWKKPRNIFVCAHSDLFHPDVDWDIIDRIFAVMLLANQHQYQVLTKRPDVALCYFNSYPWDRINEHCGTMMHWDDMPTYDNDRIPDHIHIGTSCEDHDAAEDRIPYLLQIESRNLFLSLEPLLGQINLNALQIHDHTFIDAFQALDGQGVCRGNKLGSGIGWVIIGGESGRHAAPCHPDWVRYTKIQCAEAGVPFFFKQWGEWLPWEPTAQAPYWRSQRGDTEDRHAVFPSDFDKDDNWDDGMSYLALGYQHCVFERTNKKLSGNLLDGQKYVEMPR